MSRSRLVVQLRAALAAILFIALAPDITHADDWSEAQTVTVVTVEYDFNPNSFSFKKGVAYRLHIDNQGKKMHEFTAPEFFKAIRIRDRKVVNADLTEIVIQPGEQKDLYFVAQQPGAYKLICSDHDWAGMIGDITITP